MKDSFSKNLVYVERILNQREYHKQYISYRNYPEVKDKQEKDDNKGKLKPTWKLRANQKEKDGKKIYLDNV
jgi:hypothetical protein